MVHYFHSLKLIYPFIYLFFTLWYFLIHCTVKFTYTESKTEENTSGSFVATTPSEKVPALTF